MRFLANENIPYDAILALRDKGHDVLWIRVEAPGTNDADVLKRAINEERILVTFDKDFGELAFRFRLPAQCGIILLRIPERSPAYIAKNNYCN
jgi:predicted nuclease of predicted toxin-antitoxin system